VVTEESNGPTEMVKFKSLGQYNFNNYLQDQISGQARSQNSTTIGSQGFRNMITRRKSQDQTRFQRIYDNKLQYAKKQSALLQPKAENIFIEHLLEYSHNK
jgi:hypothetical protein